MSEEQQQHMSDYSSHFSQFERISNEKRERILNAALQEFASYDYPQVSTNAIVKQAGISKGLLFHYFGDKQGLFRYLMDAITQKYTNEVMALVGLDTSIPNDVFEVLRLSVNSKLEITRRYVLETRFIIRAVKGNLPPQLREFVDAWYRTSFETMGSLAESLDPVLLREGVSKQMAAKIIEWVCVGMTEEILADVTPDLSEQEFQEMTCMVTEYIDFLRSLFYKQG